jgi:hypothetical protein
MTKEELEKEAEKKYCNGCKWRIEQCLWAWRKTNGLKEPNEKNCSCKEVPAYLAGAEPREKRIAELEAQIEKMKCCENCQTVRDAEGNCYLLKDGKCKNKDKWEIKER